MYLWNPVLVNFSMTPYFPAVRLFPDSWRVNCGKMAERSKACDSSESLPATAGFSSGYPGVGSNPTLVNFFLHYIALTTIRIAACNG